MHGRRLGRSQSHRKALRRNMAIALFTHGRITTTLAKAKEMRPFVERLVTLARKGLAAGDAGQEARRLHCFRRAIGELNDVDAARRLFGAVAPACKDRPGGYTRILRDSHHRLGDNAPTVIFELVDAPAPEPEAPAEPAKERKNAEE